MNPIRKLSVVHFAAAALSLAMALPAGAATFVKDVMLIGGSSSDVNTLKTNLLSQGWTFIAKDLNDGAGGDFVHLLYKKVDTPGGNSCYGFVTGFYIKSGSGAPDSLTYDGRTYYLTPYAGGSHFVGQNGDLNSHTGNESDSIHLYYTKDAVSPERSVNSIWFDDSSSGAVGKNGSSDGYDLNKNAGGAFIYMHYSTGAASTTVNLSALAMDYTAANGITLTGTLTANVGVSIASNATVTLSNATIDARSGFTGSGITCEGDATIILNGVNKTSGSNPGDVWNGGAGIRVLANTTLTIRGTGSLEAIGKGVAAAIGGGERIISSFGNIVIEGGTITARGGIQSAAIGGSSQDIGMPGNITITGGTVDARDDPPAGYQKSVGIGTGQYGTCGNITISGGIVNAVNIGSCVTESVCGNITISGGTVNGGHIGPRFSSCGNITISGGTVTATKNGGIHSIGKYSDSDTCGTVKIGGVTTGFIVQDPITYSSTDTTTYTAAFDANGGTGATAAITSRPDTPHQIPANGFTRAGYTFDRWNDAANGSGTSYDVDQWVILRDTTIYAQWSRNTYTIGYTLNGGSLPSGKTNPMSYNVDTATFTLNEPTRANYTFAGWTWDGHSTPTKNVSITEGSTGDKSYIANWTPIDYPISYDLAGGALPSGTSNPVSYNVTSSAIELVNPARIGYTFAGWTWTGQTTPQASVTIPTGSYGDKSYTANWTPVTYVVRFDANGAGGSMSDQTFTYDEAQNLRANAFKRTGYLFAGWSDSADGAVLYADGANVSNLTATAGTIVTLYAVWNQTPWMALQKRLDQGGTVVLSGDVAKTDVDECLMVTNAVTLDLNGHTLTGLGDDAVLYVVNDGDLTLTNSVEGAGAITGGTGGVVVYDEGVFTMNGGAISGNRNNFGGGGGVYVDDEGVFTMNGGAISGNSAYEGGGVYVADDSVFTMTGGVIANNSCMGGGGGVYVSWGSTFTVSGNPVVSGNTNSVGAADNVYLTDGTTISVNGLSAGASIGVTTEFEPSVGNSVVITSGAAAGDDRHFSSDWPNCLVGMADGEVCLTGAMTWESLQTALDAGGTVTLLNDVAAEAGDESLVVSGTVLLDLNGHTITGNGSNTVISIASGGDLTLTNSVPASGAITGGRAEQGGGVRVGGNAAFTMAGGVISGNSADPGGGVFVDSHGTFTMNGGAITNNFSAGRRGGGGGVCVYSSATFTLNGGKISGNVANAMGGGVCLFSGCTFTVSGNPAVSGNTDAEGATSNIDLPYSQKIGVGTLSAGASIGVTTGWPDAMHHVVITSGASAGDSRYFFCDVSYFHVEDIGGEVCIVTSVTPWTTLQKQLLEGGTVTLTNDCAASAYDYPLYVTNAVTLDLAGHTIAGNGDSEVISIEGGDLTLTNSVEGAGAVTGGSMGVYVNKDGVFTMNGGTISGNSSPYSNNGSGVFVAGGAFTMNDGLISGNGADSGGGVRVGTGYSYDTWEKIPGTFTMNGGVISGNSADDDGGGVYVYEDAAFALNGGMIFGNRADLGGGVYVDSTAIFSMTGGTISNNTVKSESSSWYEARGGGVYDYGAFTMTGGEISGNDANFGGGVYVVYGGTFTMGNGTISGNNADEDGGGVYVENDVIFMMNGGAISGNTAHFGGGVYVSYDSLFTMKGGAIADNSCTEGGGVYVNGAFAVAGGTISGNAAEYGGGVCFGEGEMLVSGSPVISGNTGSAMSSHNVYLEGTLIVSNLTAGASIGVKTSSHPDWDSPVTFTEGAEAGDKDCFFSDDPACSVDVGDGGELCLKRVREDAWTLLQAQLDAGGTVTLADTVSAPTLDTPSLVVTNAVTLDLAGHTISGSFHDSIFRIGAGGVLTITNSVVGAGAVTGGYNRYGGGVYVGSNGVFRLQGGAISGNRAYSGGGVSVDEFGVFTMTGGAISGNQAEGGGGVSVYGDSDDCLCPGVFTMSGGTISGNVAYDGFGGGMYMEGDAVVTLTGGEISGNAAVSWGEYGGVAVFSSAFTVAGNPVVSGNTNSVGKASNVYLPGGTTIAVDGLSAGASIGVTTETVPEDGHPVAIAAGATSGDAAHFFSDDPGCRVAMEGGELYLVAGVGFPAYLDGANELVIANYRAWAAKYGPDVTGAHEAAFLLDIDPATPIPAGAALLKIVDVSITPTRRRIEIASDVTTFEEKETEFPMLGNGFLELLATTSLSSDSDWTSSGPVPFEIRNGRAVIDQQGDSGNGQRGEPKIGKMPPALFFKATITPFADFVIGIEE